MKLHKIFLFAAVALATAFTSCSEDDTYEAGKPAGKYNVTFAEYSPVTLASDATSFEVTLQRADASEALTVPLTVLSASEGVVVPSSASFAAGEETTTIDVTLPSEMEYNTDYSVSIQIPEEYTNPYAEQATCPIYKNTFLKEDYAVEATGTYTDNFWYEESWSVSLEYSPSQDLYRVKDMFDDGCDPFFFKWNKETNVVTVTDATGTTQKYISTPFDYSGYPIVAYCNQAKFSYDPSSKTFEFPFYWYVPALSGGFGIYACYLALD